MTTCTQNDTANNIYNNEAGSIFWKEFETNAAENTKLAIEMIIAANALQNLR